MTRIKVQIKATISSIVVVRGKISDSQYKRKEWLLEIVVLVAHVPQGGRGLRENVSLCL